MKPWDIKYLPEAVKDLQALDGSQKVLVQKAIKKVSQDPRPQSEGGYGKPLGSRSSGNLTGLLKIKLRSAGLRVLYKLMRTETQMPVVVVGVREDEEVYEIAQDRRR